MNDIWTKVKPWLTEIVSCTAFFVAIYLVAWIANGIKGTHFDLSNLTNFYLMVIGKQQVQHGIDSIFNSSRGENPDNRK
jgi:hypothetical protein